jgi:ADP-heptose:LPS heptosyltransferase
MQSSYATPDWAITDDSRVAFIHMGGLGDLVLASEFIARVKTAFPRVHLSLICRSEFYSIGELLPVAPDETLALPFNPYVWDSATPNLHRELEAIASRLRGRAIDLLLDGSCSAMWFTWFVAAVLRPAHAACSAAGGASGLLLGDVLDHFGMACPEIERIEAPLHLHERERYRLLADRLGCPPSASVRWSLPDGARSLARDWLERHGFREGRYVVCFPAASGHADLKGWPEANYVDVLNRLERERNLPALLLGSAAEQSDLAQIARMTSRRIVVFSGHPRDLTLAAGLLVLARAYFGNDSGPAHLAQAFGIPGVVVFGGGHPTSFACWGAGSIGVLHPLPCFGCAWDCLLDHGLCVESIPASAVLDAMHRILDDQPGEPQTIVAGTLDDPVKEVLTQANMRYREVQLDRERRLAVIVKMKARIAMLERTAAERLELIERIDAEAERRAQLIRDLTQARADRDRIATERLALLLKAITGEADRRSDEPTDRLTVRARES